MKVKKNIVELFDEAKKNNTYLKVCAPMVRYSKIQFRTLVKNYGTDVTFTPMILADSFCQNSKARSNEFSTTASDSPLIVQFAANNALDFADASRLIYPYADGVDLNCGCPQKWALKEGYGCALLSRPDLIYDLVREVKNSITENFSISVKIRVSNDLKKTIHLCQQLEKCGITFLTVHGRTPQQKSGDSIDIAALKEVCQSVQVPVVANGGVKTLEDANILYNAVRCNGVMAASGILTNPALFCGAHRTPLSCVKLWQNMKNQDNQRITFQCYHHHLVFMLEKVLTKQQKQIFNHLSTFESVDEYLNNYLLAPSDRYLDFRCNLDDFLICDYPDEITLKHSSKCRSCSKSICYCICNKYDYNSLDGRFFTSHIETKDSLDYMDLNLFNEFDYN